MCHRSRHTYLANTELPDAQIVACSGATSSQVVQIGQHDQPPQIHHPLVTDVTTPADVAFMTLGGNDIQFAKILSQCVQGSDLPFNPTLDCDQGWGHTLGTLFLHAEDFRKAYQAVHAAINTPEHIAARDGRQAPLVVLPYPNLVPARKSGPCGLDADELRFAQALVHELNDTIRLAVAQSDNDGIIFASQVRTALGAHGMCTEDPHFNNPTLLGAAPDVILSTWQAQEWGHLDRRGYMDVTRAIQNWSYTQDFDPANPAKPAPTTFPAVNPAPAARATMGQAEAVHMPQGSSLEISGHGYAPGSPLLLTIHSTPRALLNANADEDGDVHIVAGIPWDIPVGTHQLVLAGLDPELLPVTQTATVSVGAPKPWWLAPAPFVAAGLLGLGLILLLVALLARRSRRRNATPAPPGDSL